MEPREYRSLDATALAALVAAGEVTAAELLALARERAAEVNPSLNAIIGDIGEAEERAADPELSGPFAGVPFLVKDLSQEYRGHPSSKGSRSLRTALAPEHATVTQRFLDAGLVIFGRTNAPEFGAKGITEPEAYGPTRNPWDTSRTPGGSSGGSAAAVAAGIVPAAGANDGGGSIRIPAATTGLVGLKASRGLMPYGPGHGEPMYGMAVQGALARTVRDVAGLYDALVGPFPSASYLAAPPARPFLEQIATPPRALRIGFTVESVINPVPDPEAVAAVEGAARLLESLGHTVESVHPPYDDAALARDFLTIWFAVAASEVDAAKRLTGARDRDFEADTLAVAELGRAAGVLALERALDARQLHVRTLADFHEQYDLLLTPSLSRAPIHIGELDTPPALQRASRVIRAVHGGKALAATGLLDQMISTNLGWVPYTQLANLTGRPAISVPLHWTASGLPLGVQLVGRLGADGELLQLAAQLEAAQPWIQRFTALWDAGAARTSAAAGAAR